MLSPIRRRIFWLLLPISVACDSGGTADDPGTTGGDTTGQEGKPCFANGTCFEGLSCVSQVCVDLGQLQGGKGGSGAGKGGSAGQGGGVGLGGAGQSQGGAGSGQAGKGGAGAGQGGSPFGGSAGEGGSGQAGSGGASGGEPFGGSAGESGSAGQGGAGSGGAAGVGGAGSGGSLQAGAGQGGAGAAGAPAGGAGQAGSAGAGQGGAGAAGKGGAGQGGAGQGGAGQGGAGQGGAGLGGAGQGGQGNQGGVSGAGQGGAGQGGNGGAGGGDICGGKVYLAKQAPAAMLVLLDRSSSMSGGKWTAAAEAINAALDAPVFDSMAVGLLSAPSSSVSGPDCLFNFPVPCGAPSAPQVAIQDVGAGKASDFGSLRAKVKSWLQGNAPSGGGLFDADASPLYIASEASLNALKNWPVDGKRILLVVSDGTLSCTSLSNRSGFMDGNGCPDWEDPQNFIDLFKAAHDDPQKPVSTFIVGVPGADTYDPSGAQFPPYHMRAALSAIAYAGAPEFVDPACTGKTFSQGDNDPAISCHFDMTLGGFDASALASNIAKIRGKALGCTFELPTPDGGGEVDPTLVNVEYNVGAGPTEIFRRNNPSDTCAADLCWDYNAEGKIELIGKACNDVKTSTKAAVSVVAGCKTNYKP